MIETDLSRLPARDLPCRAEDNAIRSLHRALAKWQDAAGPFWPFVCATPFLSNLGPGTAQSRPRQLPSALGRALSINSAEGRALIVADLAPERSLAATGELTRRGFIVVPVIQRWAASPAVLGCESLLEHLVTFGDEAYLPPNPRGVVLLLDGGRFGGVGGALGGKRAHAGRSPLALAERRFDNRYEYPVCRFPPAEVLSEFGIVASRWIPSVVARDLRPYFESLGRSVLGPSPLRR